MSKHKVAVFGTGIPDRSMTLAAIMTERNAAYKNGVQAERERLYRLSADEFLSEKLAHKAKKRTHV